MLREVTAFLGRRVFGDDRNAHVSKQMAIDIAGRFARRHGLAEIENIRAVYFRRYWEVRIGHDIHPPWIRIDDRTGDIIDHWGIEPSTTPKPPTAR